MTQAEQRKKLQFDTKKNPELEQANPRDCNCDKMFSKYLIVDKISVQYQHGFSIN